VTKLKALASTTSFRLAMVYLVASASFAIMLLIYVGWNAQRLLDRQILRTLDVQASSLLDQYRIGGLRRLTSVVDRRIREPGAFLLLLEGQSGQFVTGNISGISAKALNGQRGVIVDYVPPDDETGQQASRRQAMVRVIDVPGGYFMLVGRDLEERDRLTAILLQALRYFLIALVLFGVLGAFLIARRALARVDAISETSRNIMEGDLSRRLPVSGSGDELDRLATNLNAMLDRIVALMKGLREVSDNIAHDLRTPLTRVRNTAEHALQASASEKERRQALESILAEGDEIIRTFNALLLIARSEAGTGTDAFADIDLSTQLLELAEIYEPVAEDAGLSLKLSVAPGLSVRGHRQLLAQIFSNLIDNAIKYGKPEGHAGAITIHARNEADHNVVEISDNGAGIPSAMREKVLERFMRLDSSRSQPGSGLGLSLVAAIASLHDAKLELDDNAPGLVVRLVFPISTSGFGA
jgi:signal transduction histidine kinase